MRRTPPRVFLEPIEKQKCKLINGIFSIFFWEVFCSLFFLLELFPPSALVFRHFPSSVTFFRYVLCALVICGVIGSPDMYCSLCVPKLFFILFYVYSCSNHIILQQRKGPVSVLQHKKRGHRIPSETPPKRWIRLLFCRTLFPAEQLNCWRSRSTLRWMHVIVPRV